MGLDPSTFPNLRDPIPLPGETALTRIASALEQFVALQTDARAAPAQPREAVVEWLSRIDHADLDHVVMARQRLGTPVMFVVIEVLTEWAADARS